MMRRRAQDEYLFAFGFALIVSLFLAVVIWSTGTGARKSTDEFPVSPTSESDVEPIGAVARSAAAFSAPEWPAGPDVVADASPSAAERVDVTENRIAPPLRAAPLEQTTPTASTANSSSDYSIAIPGNIAGAAGWRRGFSVTSGGFYGGGGYSPMSGLTKTTESASGAEDTPRAAAQSTSRQHLTVADTAPAESATAHVSGASAGGATAGPSITTLTPALAATLDNLVPPATVFEDASWPARDSSASSGFEEAGSTALALVLATPDPIAELVESYGDPLALLAQPDLGIEPPSFTVQTAEKPTVNPEPASLLLLGTGLGLVARRLRRRGEPRVELA